MAENFDEILALADQIGQAFSLVLRDGQVDAAVTAVRPGALPSAKGATT